MKQTNVFTLIMAIMFFLATVFGLNTFLEVVAAPEVHAQSEIERQFVLVTDDGMRVDLVAVYGLEWDMRFGENGADLEPYYGNIVIQRLFPENEDALTQWVEGAKNGNTAPKSGDIVAYDNNDQELYRFNIQNAEPVRWSLPGVQAENEPVEEIELSVQKVDRVLSW